MKRREPGSGDPIKRAPLRDPGQSLKEKLDAWFLDNVVAWFVVCVLVVIVTCLEWLRWALSLPPSPVTATVTSVGIIGFAIWHVRRAMREHDNLKLGLKGERAIGQLLQTELLPRGYAVFHDICVDDFNIDHAAIGPGGVFAIEAKTRSKRDGDARVTYNGEGVLVDGRKPDRDPISQARASAKQLESILLEFSGEPIKVRPVVLFPGWFVETMPRGAEVWVLNEKALPKFLDHEANRLSEAQQRVFAEALARYVRQHDEKVV